MQQQASPQPSQIPAQPAPSIQDARQSASAQPQRVQACPQCGYPMSDLKGGREAICRNCGFKDSCCY